MEFKENGNTGASFCSAVLIESDWNLKDTTGKTKNTYSFRINRIRFEFKVDSVAIPVAAWNCINRIRLEFKAYQLKS